MHTNFAKDEIHLFKLSFLHFGDISCQVDSVRNQCNKNIQKLMEEMHFLEMVSTRELLF